MKISPFFKNLFSLYEAEIDDLSTNSNGANVLESRLNQKRKQLKQLLPMLAFSPEMVAAAFHGAFRFNAFRKMELIVACDVSVLPDWVVIAPSLSLAPWAEPLLSMVLAAEGGSEFMVQTAGLEFLIQHHERDHAHGADDKSSDHEDLAEAGGEWMAGQGFDRLG